MNDFYREMLRLAAATAPATPPHPPATGRGSCGGDEKGLFVSRRIYVASSWRNTLQPGVVQALRGAGHQVYDFREPTAGSGGFSWKDVDPGWKNWSIADYVTHLDSPVARDGFTHDWNAMVWADTCVLVLPCGRSAHLEAGYFRGAGKRLHILLHSDGFEAELMYRMADRVHTSLDSLLDALDLSPGVEQHWDDE